MILFDLIKEVILEIQKFYGKTLLRNSLTVSGKTIFYFLSSKRYVFGKHNINIGWDPNKRIVIVHIFQNRKDDFTIDFDDILSNDLEYLVLIYGKNY